MVCKNIFEHRKSSKNKENFDIKFSHKKTISYLISKNSFHWAMNTNQYNQTPELKGFTSKGTEKNCGKVLERL